MRPVAGSTPYCTELQMVPLWFTGAPCERWPPCGSAIPRIVSPGGTSAMNAAKLACAPECGCTLACVGAEELLEPVDRELLDLVHHLTPTVIALAGIPFGVLVGERRPHRVDHRAAREILAGDQLEPLLLPAQLPIDEPRDDRIRVAQRGVMVRASWSLPFDFGDPAACRPPLHPVLSPGKVRAAQPDPQRRTHGPNV